MMRETIQQTQNRVAQWVKATFGQEVAMNKKERALRILEEALELAQAADLHPDDCRHLVDYVYDRPCGDIMQEHAGVFITCLASAEAWGFSLEGALMSEWRRLDNVEMMGKCAQKHKDKPSIIRAV